MNKIINNRYEIIRSVGSGGMAEVFLAHDNLLDRNVAIKVLRDQFVADKELLEQFKREAKSAARLIHPYIINIYDVISEGDIQYIVMEYVEGVTLKEYLKDHKLPLNAVLEIAVRLADALKHAHSKNIIHCDIKPQNILIDKNLNPKITDFGIAKMVSNQTMVYTSAVMGSVHYISPEQATGGKITACSDVYSLGIVLFEMLTGTVPYNGNTAVSVAMMHAEKPIPSLKDYMEEVPEGLQEIINKALAKKCEDRYQDADELRKDLMDLKLKLYPFSSDDYKKDIKVVLPSAENDFNKTAAAEEDATLIMKPMRSNKQEEPAVTAEAAEIPAAQEDDMARTVKRKKKLNFNKILICLTAFVVVISGIAHILFNHSRDVAVVPDVVKMDIADAQVMLEDKGFEVDIEEIYGKGVKPGVVMEQSPKGGEKRKEGSTIYLKISKGAELKNVPDVIGMALEKAKKIILDEGYEIGRISKKFVEKEALGSILEQSPKAMDKAPKGSKVNLVVNESSFTVPDIMGKTVDEVTAALSSSKLALGQVKYAESEKTKGTVIAVNPAVGSSAKEGTKVDVTVSSGSAASKEASSIYVDFIVPGEKQQHVQIYLITSAGRKLMFDGDKQGGVRIRQKVDVSENTKIQFYCDNKLVEEKSL